MAKRMMASAIQSWAKSAAGKIVGRNFSRNLSCNIEPLFLPVTQLFQELLIFFMNNAISIHDNCYSFYLRIRK